jgi:hypothetical protein
LRTVCFEILRKKLKNYEPEPNVDLLHNVDILYKKDKMTELMFPVLYDDEYSYIVRNSSGGKNSPDINYIDKNTEWFQFCKPVIYGGFENKRTADGKLMQKPKTMFRKGDLLTIWQTLGAGGAEHLLCVIVHKGQLYSFGFGFRGMGEKQQSLNPKIASVFSKFVHLVDVHPGSIYTPDYLFEIRMYDQILKKRSQVKLIANSYLLPHHIEAIRTEFDQIDFYRDDRNRSKISCRLLPGSLFDVNPEDGHKKMEEIADYLMRLIDSDLTPYLEDSDQVEMATYLISTFVSSIVTIGSQIKMDSSAKQILIEKLLQVVSHSSAYETKVNETLKPFFEEMKKTITQSISLLQKQDSTDDSPRLLCFIKNLVYLPSARYCEWSSQSSKDKNLANCASFMYRLFGDILTCSGSSIVFHPKYCKQNETSIKSNCNVYPFAV